MKLSSNLVLVLLAFLAVSVFASPGVAAPMDSSVGKQDNCRCVPYYQCDASKLLEGDSDSDASCSSPVDICCPI